MKVSPETLEILPLMFSFCNFDTVFIHSEPQGANIIGHHLFISASAVFYYNLVPPNGSKTLVPL